MVGWHPYTTRVLAWPHAYAFACGRLALGRVYFSVQAFMLVSPDHLAFLTGSLEWKSFLPWHAGCCCCLFLCCPPSWPGRPLPGIAGTRVRPWRFTLATIPTHTKMAVAPRRMRRLLPSSKTYLPDWSTPTAATARPVQHSFPWIFSILWTRLLVSVLDPHQTISIDCASNLTSTAPNGRAPSNPAHVRPPL